MTDDHDWPKDVRVMSLEQLNHLGVREVSGELYWRGRPVEMKRPLVLSSWQKLAAFVVAAFTIIGALGAVAQGWAAYNDWACKVHWWAVCPPN
jgi:hypothetical protein